MWFDLFQSYSRDMRDLKIKVQTYTDEKESMMGEHTDLQKQKAKLELDLSDLSSELDGESSQKVKTSKYSFDAALWFPSEHPVCLFSM